MSPHFGGGKELLTTEIIKYKSLYPGAKLLSFGADLYEPINDWLTINGGGLIIRLRAGKV